ncbi:MAG TPA: hypothetical protein VNK26_04210 [Pyrinomonadaceae bacterium]|nr:hypothetical protein [Pyrinomonadaceae bacterium]
MVVYKAALKININEVQMAELQKIANQNLHSFRKLTTKRLLLYFNGRDVGRHYLEFLRAVAAIVIKAEGEVIVNLFYTGEKEYNAEERYKINCGRLELITT